MPQDTPSRHLDQYVVRFPDGLRDRLKNEAKKNNRSLNAEIVARLEQTLATPAPSGGGAELLALLERVAAGIRRLEDRGEVD